MTWLAREVSLLTAAAGFLAAVRPGWWPVVTAVWLVAVSVLVVVTALAEMLDRWPQEPSPAVDERRSAQRLPGRTTHLREIEHANDFLLAVEYQLQPFLRQRLREIAADRLLVGHNVDLDRQPERSRRLLGAEVWQLVRPAIGGDEAAVWKAMSVQRLQQAIQALEVV